jgi:hypothetical protein
MPSLLLMVMESVKLKVAPRLNRILMYPELPEMAVLTSDSVANARLAPLVDVVVPVPPVVDDGST